MTAPHLYRVILPVSDIEVAARFYSYVFEDAGERVSPGRHYFDCNGVILACYDPSADGDDVGQGWAPFDYLRKKPTPFNYNNKIRVLGRQFCIVFSPPGRNILYF